MMQYYLGINDPGMLSDDEWGLKWQMLQHIRKEEARLSGGKLGNTGRK